MVNLKTFYNREFLEKTRVFIIQNAEHYIPPSEQDKPNPNSTPIMSSKKLLRQMNLDSPLVNTVPSLRHNAENSVFFLNFKKPSIEQLKMGQQKNIQ